MKNNEFGAWPKTQEELIKILNEHENKQHDYSSVAESLTEVTLAMFNYFASKQGMTGFQASWAAMRFLARSRNIEGPWGIVDGSQMLYPQYDLRVQLEKWMEEWKPQIGKMAVEKLNSESRYAHPDVIARWMELATYAPKDDSEVKDVNS
jgi:hypothetical protein